MLHFFDVKQEAEMSQRGCAMLHAVKKFAKSLKIVQFQIYYLTYEIHIIRQYNIGVTLYALFLFLVRLI